MCWLNGRRASPARPRGGAGLSAVRVLWAGVDRGLAGSGVFAGAAVAAGGDARGGARRNRGGVLRHRGEPDLAGGAAAAALAAQLADPDRGWGCDRDRGVRARVLGSLAGT